MSDKHLPVLEVTRGGIVESIHYGSIAVVDSGGNLLWSFGDPQNVTFLRSSCKPFQALPLIEAGGDQFFHLTSRELAIICGSHDGSDEHVQLLREVFEKVGINEDNLQCGIQPPLGEYVEDQLKVRNEIPTSIHHNCSGNHAGMLAFARLSGLPISNYISSEHPIQKKILETFSAMCELKPDQVTVGVDGCSAPAYAVPLYNTALAYARLCDPKGLGSALEAACRRVTTAMMTNPAMVAGPNRFDTRIMQVGVKRILSKGGAEGFLSLGIMPGVLDTDSLGIGIAIKISDGDAGNRARPAVAIEVLRQLNILNGKELELLQEFGPNLELRNWRKIVVGESHPVFQLVPGAKEI